MSTLIVLGISAVLAISVTAFLCRRRIVRKKKPGILTTLLGTLIPATCMTISIYVCQMGSEAFARHHGWPLIQVIFINALVFCFIPAVLVVIFYQIRNKEIHDA
jgi:branched-subunit amino acid transport protein AzlD